MSKAQSAGRVPAVSIIYGKRGKEDYFDEYLASEHLARIKAAMGGETPIAISEFEAAEADLADVLDEVSTPAMWGSSRLIILRDAEEVLAPAAAERERLAPFVARMTAIASMKDAPGRLVLVARGLDVSKDGEVSSSFDAARELIAAVGKASGLCPAVPPYERELKGMLVRTASAQGVQLLPAAADALVAAVGTDQMTLQEELEKLITRASETKRITPEDVREVVALRPEGNVFSLAEKILDGDTATSLSILASLREITATRSSVFILASLATSFRRYLSSAFEMERGATAQQAAARTGVPFYFQKDYVRRLERWNAKALTALLDRALQCDIDVKTGTVSEETALETFVIDACAGHLESRELVGRWLYEI